MDQFCSACLNVPTIPGSVARAAPVKSDTHQPVSLETTEGVALWTEVPRRRSQGFIRSEDLKLSGLYSAHVMLANRTLDYAINAPNLVERILAKQQSNDRFERLPHLAGFNPNRNQRRICERKPRLSSERPMNSTPCVNSQ